MKYQINEDNVIIGIYFDVEPKTMLNANVNFGVDKYVDGILITASEVEKAENLAKITEAEMEDQNKSSRARYLDAYRKYQASINYGEYERVPEVDAFVRRLQDKDWTALEDVPPALAYFAGECGFDESGLKRPGII